MEKEINTKTHYTKDILNDIVLIFKLFFQAIGWGIYCLVYCTLIKLLIFFFGKPELPNYIPKELYGEKKRKFYI